MAGPAYAASLGFGLAGLLPGVLKARKSIA